MAEMFESPPTQDFPGMLLPELGLHEDDEPTCFLPLRLQLQPLGKAIELQRGNMLLGRHTTADIRVPLPDISRRHCRFVFAEGQWEVIDLNSLNGIRVNGEQRREAKLQHGDFLRIGSLTFRVELAGEEAKHQILRNIVDALPVNEEPQRQAS